jgi:hypothetical protein
MARTTQKELEHLADLINTRLGIEADAPERYHVGRQDGSPRLHRDGGGVDVSPRLPAGQLGAWMEAYLVGLDAGIVHILTAEHETAVEELIELRAAVPASLVVGWEVCTGCHESYNPDDSELHDRCSE